MNRLLAAGSAIMIATLALAGRAPGQELWNGVRAGMSSAEAVVAAPAAAAGQLSREGDEQILRVGNLRAGGHDAVARLEFSAGRLQRVELRLSDAAGRPAVDPAEIRRQLEAKYGAAAGCDAEGQSCEWRSGDVDIELVAPRPGDGPGVSIIYRPAAAPGAEPSPAEIDPVSLVREFYGDLARGDGDDAARLIVPEKRLRGHLSAGALTAFYSALPGPIHLTTAKSRGGGDVFVRYQFVARGDRLCDGAADVHTVLEGRDLLIGGIRAYSGC